MTDYGAIRDKYLEGGKAGTLAHVKEVADTAEWLGRIHGLDVEKLRLAAMLHDVSAVISPEEMYRIATERGMTIDPAEEKYRFLLHQRISKIMAREEFGVTDEDVLSAIECHTTLRKGASVYDKAVFLADKISWDRGGVPPYYDELKTRAEKSLDDACLYFIRYQFDNGLLLMPHTWLTEAYEELKGMGDTKVSFRKATAEDCLALSELKKAVWNTTYKGIYPQERLDGYDVKKNEEIFRGIVANPEIEIYVAEDADEIVGFMTVGKPYKLYEEYDQEVGLLYIRKDYQRKGIGRRFIDIAKAEVEAKGFDRFILSVNAQNAGAIAFYTAMGGEIVLDDGGQKRIMHKIAK